MGRVLLAAQPDQRLDEYLASARAASSDGNRNVTWATGT
jgi:hypothetical protein